MLGKLLDPFRHHGQLNPSHKSSGSVLKLVHPGGRVECYYKAMSASKLMERYPSFLIAKPSVFKQPWDSIVQPEDTLFPGQKFFIVPQRTVKKLRRRIQKPNTNLTSFDSYVTSSSSVTRGTKIAKAKISAKKCFGIDKSEEYDQSLDFSKSINAGRSKSRAMKVVQVAAWHPALESISEM